MHGRRMLEQQRHPRLRADDPDDPAASIQLAVTLALRIGAHAPRGAVGIGHPRAARRKGGGAAGDGQSSQCTDGKSTHAGSPSREQRSPYQNQRVTATGCALHQP